MSVCLISYDLDGSDKSDAQKSEAYRQIGERIGRLSGEWRRVLTTTWIGRSAGEVPGILDVLRPLVGEGKLLVSQLGSDHRWRGFDESDSHWLDCVLA